MPGHNDEIEVAPRAGYAGDFANIWKHSCYQRLVAERRKAVPMKVVGMGEQALRNLSEFASCTSVKSNQEFHFQSSNNWLTALSDLLNSEDGLNFLMFHPKKYQIALSGKTGFWVRKTTVYLSVNPLTFVGELDKVPNDALSGPQKQVLCDWFQNMDAALSELQKKPVTCGC